MITQPHVEFGMYPFESVAWAWDDLWSAVHTRVPWTPAELTRSGDVHGRWYDADCIITHVCGWPFAALHRNDMVVIGAFGLDIDEASPHGRYRSVLLSATDEPLGERDWSTTHAVANSADSLSGWHSLRAGTVGPAAPWPGTVTYTSAHIDSLRALNKREADIACIDSWSLALIASEKPDLIDGLHRIGLGPVIPTPAITARASLSNQSVTELRAGFADALAADETLSARRALRIASFEPLVLDDYLDTLPLGHAR